MNKFKELTEEIDPVKYKELKKFMEDVLKQYASKKTVGRPKAAQKDEIQRLKANGLTQEQIARELNISVSTARRYWK